jgi:hypothetical protein
MHGDFGTKNLREVITMVFHPQQEITRHYVPIYLLGLWTSLYKPVIILFLSGKI